VVYAVIEEDVDVDVDEDVVTLIVEVV